MDHAPPPTDQPPPLGGPRPDVLRRELTWAAAEEGLAFLGSPVLGARQRSAGAPVIDASGHRRWLRVAAEPRDAAPAPSGAAPAGLPAEVPAPALHASRTRTDGAVRWRVELLTLLPGTPCAAESTAPDDPALPHLSEEWWAALTAALRRVATVPADGAGARVPDEAAVLDRVRETFGPGMATTVPGWETAHGALHWAHLMAEPLGVLGWESWGRAPVGTDAATLYCHSLTVPEVAAEVRERFPVLDQPVGRTALLWVTAGLVRRTADGAHPRLFAPVRQLAGRLLTD